MRRLVLAAGIALLPFSAPAAAQPLIVADTFRNLGVVVALPAGGQWKAQLGLAGEGQVVGAADSTLVFVQVLPAVAPDDQGWTRTRILEEVAAAMLDRDWPTATRTPEEAPAPAGALVRGFRLAMKIRGVPVRGWARFSIAETGAKHAVMVLCISWRRDPFDDPAVRRLMASVTFDRPGRPIV